MLHHIRYVDRMPYRPMPCASSKICSNYTPIINLPVFVVINCKSSMSAITRSSSDELQVALNAKYVNKSNSLLNGYEILRILGKGNYGSVVLASRPLSG